MYMFAVDIHHPAKLLGAHPHVRMKPRVVGRFLRNASRVGLRASPRGPSATGERLAEFVEYTSAPYALSHGYGDCDGR